MAAYPFQDARPADAHVPNSARYVCSLNTQIRHDNVYGTMWQPAFFAVGTTWGGNAYFMDTAVEQPEVNVISQDSQIIRQVAPTLDSWFSQLRTWYVEFDNKAASLEYSTVVARVRAAGLFATSPEPLDGWHRISVAPTSGQHGQAGGRSCWISTVDGNWFAGTWTGNIYRVSGNISQFCLTWLTPSGDQTDPDSDAAVKRKFGLELLSDNEAQKLFPG